MSEGWDYLGRDLEKLYYIKLAAIFKTKFGMKEYNIKRDDLEITSFLTELRWDITNPLYNLFRRMLEQVGDLSYVLNLERRSSSPMFGCDVGSIATAWPFS